MLGKRITVQGIILGAALVWFTHVEIGKKCLILYYDQRGVSKFIKLLVLSSITKLWQNHIRET